MRVGRTQHAYRDQPPICERCVSPGFAGGLSGSGPRRRSSIAPNVVSICPGVASGSRGNALSLVPSQAAAMLRSADLCVAAEQPASVR